jgi:DNA/RNA-binding protein KIN17
LGGVQSGNGGGKKRKAAGKISLVEEDDENEPDDQEQDTKPNHKRLDQSVDSSGNNTKDAKPSHKQSSNDTNNNVDSKKKQKSSSKDRKDYWLHRNIIVRIISKKLSSGKYYKRKAIVDKVIDKYSAEVEVMDSSHDRDGGDILRIDQDDLETVIPKEIGEKVRILNGRWRGKKARVEKLDKKRYEADLRLVDEDRIVTLDYEDFSMIA